MSVGCDDAGSGRRQWRQQSSGDGGQERVTAEEMKEHGRQEETMAVLSLPYKPGHKRRRGIRDTH